MIAVCPNPYRDAGLKLTMECIRMLRAEGYEVNDIRRQTVSCHLHGIIRIPYKHIAFFDPVYKPF